MKLSIVIPALNEEQTIAICVKKALNALNDLGVTGEILVIDNGSIDNTAHLAAEAGARVIHISEKGYGSACIAGFQGAKGEFLIMGDADDSYNFEEIAPFVDKLNEGYELVMGNRFKGRIEKNAMPFLNRYLGTPVLTLIMNLFFNTKIGDMNCGMRGFTKKAFIAMRLKTTGMEFATEMIIKASRLKLKIAEVPCNLYKDKRGRKSHLDPWRDGWRHLRFMLLFTPSRIFLTPGLMLIIIGLSVMITLTLRDVLAPNMWSSTLGQKHMLSAMLLFLFGTQIISLGLIAELFSFSKHFDYARKGIRLIHKYFRLEKGILCGIIFVLFSVSAFIYLFISYLKFLPSLSLLLRFDLAVFAIVFFMLGVQFIYTSFVLSLFYLKIK